MSIFAVHLQIGDLAGRTFEAVEAVVDTGSTFTAAPRALLERVGVTPTRRERFRVPNGAFLFGVDPIAQRLIPVDGLRLSRLDP